ncbi:SsgA family sporulation/cell division regulator [Kitasatospora paranensis]|uniref:SsgA family sporulation/cell division regulator n=1 Tax=Kitasatospora paranensis TaxID=258053 RepID=A0ABW2FRN6_9ACTN
MPATVEHESTVHLTGPAAGDLRMLMRYRSGDPYAVRLVFLDPDEPDTPDAPDGRGAQDGRAAGEGRAAEDGAVTWWLGRELLTVGLARPCGTGDVAVRPLTAELLELSFAAPGGAAVVHVSTRALQTFLRATYALVPAGSETARLAVPDDLSVLFESSGENPW